MATALDQALYCPICLEIFNDPVSLPCMHSYCRQCLVSMLVPKRFEDKPTAVCTPQQQELDGDYSGRVIQCPECRYIAVLDKDGVQNLPSNYTLANIVEKYAEPQIETCNVPCDICDETPAAKACKHCKECKISYCAQCLFLHPKRGVLSKHKLVDTKDIATPKEQICLTCRCIVLQNDAHEEHSETVVEREIAIYKMLFDIQYRYSAILDEKKKVALDNINKIENSLRQMKNGVIEIQKEIRNKFEEEARDVLKMQISIEKKGMEQIGQQQCMVKSISDMLMQITFHTEIENINIEDLLELEKRVEEIAKQSIPLSPLEHIDHYLHRMRTNHTIPVTTAVPETIKCSEADGPNIKSESVSIDSPDNDTNQAIERIVITKCKSIPTDSVHGACLAVTWNTAKCNKLYELKFTCRAAEGNIILIVTKIRGPLHRQYCLKYETIYTVTVSLMESKQSESIGFQITTLPKISCKEFQFSPVLISKGINIHWNGKLITHGNENQWGENRLTKIIGGGGTLLMHHCTQYWEVDLSFHLRGIPNCTFVAAVGICPKESLDAAKNILNNYYFYGIAICKNNRGTPSIQCFHSGKSSAEVFIQSSRSYHQRFGFLFNSNTFKLSVIDCKINSLLFTSRRLKSFPYIPAFQLSNTNDVQVALITGADILELPPCIHACL